MAKCYLCGEDDSVKDTWRYCSYKKEFVCKQCCQICQYHSSKLLPNGTNCKMTYNPVGALIGNTQEILENKRIYEGYGPEQRKRVYADLKEAFKRNEDNPDIRARLRCKLAAMRMLMEGQ